ncbi:MAG: hypothetical protein HY951_13145 [Bacteroidia bacterium]|nr:hypothetical protein [Bacteroidia bacterium]
MKIKIRYYLIFILFIVANFSFGQVKSEIAKQNKKGKVVFLIVGDGKTDISESKEIALKTQKLYSKSAIIEMDKTDSANTELVNKYNIKEWGAPIIIVIANNGALCGFYTKSMATIDALLKAIPTKKHAEALLAFSENKAVFVIMYKDTMKNRTAVIEECNKASKVLNGNSINIEIDLDDKSEDEFIKQLAPNLKAVGPVVHVFNSKGKLAKKFEYPFEYMDILSAIKKSENQKSCSDTYTNGVGTSNKHAK